MTEEEWLTGTDPRPMFEFVRMKPRASARVLRLFAAAFWEWQSHRVGRDSGRRLRQRVGLLEQWAESGKMPADIQPGRSHDGFFAASARRMAASAVTSPATWGKPHGPRAVAMLPGLIRDVFGNPFRRVRVKAAWLTSDVTALAGSVYAERAFDRLPILADALQDAGCEDAAILDHCRSPGPHVRGCWVVDLILGKS